MPHNGAPEVRGHLCGLLVCFLDHVLSKGHFIFTIFFLIPTVTARLLEGFLGPIF